ncbi:MAG TPA: SDR family oxidoreductase [Stellaceae bacterium]|nr:SDR family oxidoreductase [Stellaceae bacterium]
MTETLSLENPLAGFRLDGEVAAITGGGSGIGRAIAVTFARVGADIAILDRNEAAAAAAADSVRKAGGKAEIFVLDIVDEAAVDRAFADLGKRLGRLDVLVNSAAIAIRKPATELPRADWEKVMDVNVTGSFLCARAAARLMLPRAKGSIVNMASIMGQSGGIYPNVSYQTSKGAVVNMTRALAMEWARQGIRVNAIAPSWVKTELAMALLEKPDVRAEIERATPNGRVAEVEEIVGAALFLASRASSMVTGHVLAVDGGYLAR